MITAGLARPELPTRGGERVTVTFGWEPPEFMIPLPRLGDYLLALQAPTAWPDDSAIELRFYRTYDVDDDPDPFIWAATVDGDTARWHVTAAQLAAVRTAIAKYGLLVYTDTAGTLLQWMTGTYRVT